MLPKLLYDALPYIYLAVGVWVAVSIENTFAFISGTIFGVTAIYVFWLRGIFFRKR